MRDKLMSWRWWIAAAVSIVICYLLALVIEDFLINF